MPNDNRLCIQCRRPESDPTPWVLDNPGKGCLYGLEHLYEEDLAPKAKQPQVKKPSKSLCIKCGLHPKNPLAQTNGCEHEFPE